MMHWRTYNPQPQCDVCAKFIPYERASLRQKSDGMPEPSPVLYWVGKCVQCETDPTRAQEAIE